MANLAKDRNTVKKAPSTYAFQYVANALAATKYYIGLMVCVDASNNAVQAITSAHAALKVPGVVKDFVDNSLGATADKKVELESGEFEFDKHATTPPTAIGQKCYASDNHTVSVTAADGPLVGIAVGINANSIDVGVGPAYWT